MDINPNKKLFSCNRELIENNNSTDTTLSLDFFGYGEKKVTGLRRARAGLGNHIISSGASDDGCRLVLGLGPAPTTSHDDWRPIDLSNSNASKTLLHQEMSSESDSILKLGVSGGTDDVTVLKSPFTSQNDLHASHIDQVAVVGHRVMAPVSDEGSTSAKKSGGYMPSLLFAPSINSINLFWQPEEMSDRVTKSYSHPRQLSSEPSAVSDNSMSTVSELATDGTLSSYQTSNTKKCKFEGCTKGARGATGLCIGHGGGQRCQKPGCNKGAESRTAYCKAHGGGRRCEHLGCTKSAEGRTDYCIAHGGGKRCGHPSGCAKAARGKSGLCIKHGGGKRCKVEGCTRSAEGQIGLCISHGGGRRCQFQSCNKGAQGSTMFCKAHGGGKRCIFAGCTKGAEGSTPLCKGHGGGKRCLFDGGGICPKSVHGGTNFCVAHGGGKRCAVSGCTKSARGRTDSCVRHGGGKRCQFENCDKSAQGSTNFCKAHGGGKRCSWGDGKCEKFARGRSGLCAAHSSLAQDRDTNNKGLIGPGLFHGLVHTLSTGGSSYNNTYSLSGASALSEYTMDSRDRPAKRQCLIPPQVLVPLSMKSSTSYLRPSSSEKHVEGSIRSNNADSGSRNCSTRKNFEFVVPEGRVHGGGLMSLLGGDMKNAIDGT